MSNQEIQDSNTFPRCVQKVRAWEDRHLPRSKSYIAFDLFILLGHSAILELPLTLKELFNSLNHSERGVRYVLAQFIDDGLCEIIGDEQDRRFRRVVATELLRTKLTEYEQHVMTVFDTLISAP
ncbi:MAG: hypothetical protein ACOYB1_07305 [Limnohabitans sp.]